MSNAIVSYIYPGSEKYFYSFIQTLNNLDTLDSLELIIFNDGLTAPEEYFSTLKLRFRIIENSGSINQTRFNSFKILNQLNFHNIYFQDIDDSFSPNRFNVLASKLEIFDLVSNDLKIMIRDKVDDSGIWSDRISNNFIFDYTFLIDKNIVGLGNTGIKAQLLNALVSHDESPIAYDWFFFYQLMKLNNVKGVFTNECFTYYNQHQNNIAGANVELTEARKNHIYNVKKTHYSSLLKIGHHELLPFMNDLDTKTDSHGVENKSKFWWE